MADNFNINTTQGQANEAEGLDQSNPAMTYVDFANQIAKNSLNTQQQQQQIQDAALKLQQDKQAQLMGVNPNLANRLSIPEATALLKAAGVDDDTIQQYVDTLGDQQTVNRQDLEAVIRKKQLSIKQSGVGKDYKTTDNITIPPGMTAEQMGLVPDPTKSGIGHVPSDGQYQVTEDPESGLPVYFVPEGETPPATGTGVTTPLQTAKRWSDLEKQLTQITKVGRGTALTQSLMRANRALNYLANHPNLDHQGLQYIQQDVVGIFQGGVPTEEEMRNADYTTAMQRVNNLIGQYTGNFGTLKWNATTAGDKSYVRDQLQQTLLDMRQGINQTLQTMIQAMADGYQDIIQQNPARWQQMLTDQEKILDSGLTKNASSLVAPIVPEEQNSTAASTATSTTSSATPQVAAPTGPRKTTSGISYTVNQ